MKLCKNARRCASFFHVILPRDIKAANRMVCRSVFGLQSGYFRLAVLQLLILQSISPNRLFLSDNRNLFHFLASLPSFQCKHHISSPFKKADIAFPTNPAFAVEQTDKLLLHLPAAIWADPFAAHLCPSGWIMEASEQEIPYFRSNSRARVSPSWVI